MIETAVLIVAAFLAVVAVVGLIEVLRRLSDRRRLQEELARLEGDGAGAQSSGISHDEEDE